MVQVLTINDLNPDPRPILDRMVAESDISGLVFGYIHGSMVYRPQGSIVGGYKETRIVDPKTEEVIHIEYEPKAQPPDIDLVVVVKDQKRFGEYFHKLATDYGLNGPINYFFTMNVSSQEAHDRELASEKPRALKRILAHKLTKGFGDMSAHERAIEIARRHATSVDEAFNEELARRKTMMTDAVANGHRPFSLSAEGFKSQFPLLYANLHTGAGEFPDDRDKIVLPRSMDIKGKRYVGSDVAESLR